MHICNPPRMSDELKNKVAEFEELAVSIHQMFAVSAERKSILCSRRLTLAEMSGKHGNVAPVVSRKTKFISRGGNDAPAYADGGNSSGTMRQ